MQKGVHVRVFMHTVHHYTCFLCFVLFLQVKHRRSELLKHELVSTFLRQKFTTLRIGLYLANFFLYALFLIFLTSYALTLPTPLDDICELMLTANEKLVLHEPNYYHCFYVQVQ